MVRLYETFGILAKELPTNASQMSFVPKSWETCMLEPLLWSCQSGLLATLEGR